MHKTTLAVIAVVAVLACAGGTLYYLYDSHPRYTVSNIECSELLDTASFVVEADLASSSTISFWVGDEQLETPFVGFMQWTVPSGHLERTFTVVLPDGMTAEEFEDLLEVHFDGKAGWRV